jgi:flagellin-like protein
MEKRGISAIVATVLIILITVSAVGIVWLIIIPMISDNLEIEDFDPSFRVITSNGYTVYDAAEEKILIQVSGGVDDGRNIDKLKFLVSFGGNSMVQISDAPAPNGLVTYAFDVRGYGVPTGVSVSPLIIKGGKTIEGSASSRVEFSKSNILSLDDYSFVLFGEGECVEGETFPCGATKKEYFKSLDETFLPFSYVMGQTFTVGTLTTNEDYVLEYVRIRVKNIGGDGNVTLGIYETSEGLPVGEPISQGTFSNGPVGVIEWKIIQMDHVNLLESKQYALVPISGNVWEGWYYDVRDAGTYQGGNILLDVGNGFVGIPTYFLGFEVWARD